MATEMAERKATKVTHIGVPPPEPEHLPCPRCDSTNTKFCYYNNYNFSQPRHFCKSCRRYWTHGGTLRDIPIGGGTRKNAKRSRASVSAASSGGQSVFALPHHDYHYVPATGSQFLVPNSGDHGGCLPFVNEGKMSGSFTSLLTTQGAGLWALGGFGHGLDDLGFGLGRTAWPFHGVVEGGPNAAANTWQLENGQGGFVGGGECFSLPELAISTPGSMLK